MVFFVFLRHPVMGFSIFECFPSKHFEKVFSSHFILWPGIPWVTLILKNWLTCGRYQWSRYRYEGNVDRFWFTLSRDSANWVWERGNSSQVQAPTEFKVTGKTRVIFLSFPDKVFIIFALQARRHPVPFAQVLLLHLKANTGKKITSWRSVLETFFA